MNKLIGGALALLLFVGVGLVVAQSQEITTSVTPVVDAIKELVGIQSKIADGVALKGEYVVSVSATKANVTAYGQAYKVMPVGTCNYVTYARDEKGALLKTNEVKIETAAYSGGGYRDLDTSWTGTIDFDDEYFLLSVNFTNTRMNVSQPLIGYFEYSCN